MSCAFGNTGRRQPDRRRGASVLGRGRAEAQPGSLGRQNELWIRARGDLHVGDDAGITYWNQGAEETYGFTKTRPSAGNPTMRAPLGSPACSCKRCGSMANGPGSWIACGVTGSRSWSNAA